MTNLSTETSTILKTLADPKSPLSDTLRWIDELDKAKPFGTTLRFGISSNVTVDLLGTYLRKHALLNERHAQVVPGSFDAHLDNVDQFARDGIEHVVFLQFFDALVPGFESRVPTLDAQFIEEVRSGFVTQLRIFLDRAKGFKSVFIPLFHRFTPVNSTATRDAVALTIESFNQTLRDETAQHANVKLLNVAELVNAAGRDACFNERFYYKFKAPYGAAFWDRLARDIFLQLKGGGKYFYKALVLDCDNTLWGGIIGEDLLHGIKINPHNYPDNIYWYVQNEILALQRKGALLVLCSKNNAKDVDEVLSQHPHQVLKDDHIIVKKVNWTDKSSNLRAIAQELNIGLDSLVFIDDSSFEIEGVRAQLPMVKTFQVPKNIFEYPAMIREVRDLFALNDAVQDGADKTAQYRIRAQAMAEAAQFSNQEEYLKSLQLKVTMRLNHRPSVARISELTQKSNQFNVTTRRYSEQEVIGLMESKDAEVFTLNVADKFGDHGLTGILIAKYQGKELVIDNFLMSCRVIGRGVEFCTWDTLFKRALSRGCTQIKADYLKTAKNSLVEDFFDRLGLKLIEKSGENKHYLSPLTDIPPYKQDHIEVKYEF